MIRFILLLILCLFLLTLGLSNSQSFVSLNYFFGIATRPIPVAWLITGTLAAGMVLGWLFVLPGWVRLKLELRRRRKAQDRLEEDLSLYRKTPEAEDIKAPGSSELDDF
jgi:uncharacterized membrane protein YciS (DUF1049 family)